MIHNNKYGQIQNLIRKRNKENKWNYLKWSSKWIIKHMKYV